MGTHVVEEDAEEFESILVVRMTLDAFEGLGDLVEVMMSGLRRNAAMTWEMLW